VTKRRWLVGGLVAALLTSAALAVAGSAGAADTGSVSREDGIVRLRNTRDSVDRTLALIKSGHVAQALKTAQDGYLSQFELVEIPLRIADNTLTIDTESKFAEIRQLIRDHAPVGEIRDQIVELRGMLDDAERTLTSAGVGAPMLIAGQSFLILFREGFEVVLLLSVLLGYLEAAKSPRLMKPILGGVALACVATVLTVLLMPVLFSLLPVSREVLEALTALLAVAILFYVSFWLIARLEHRRWMEFVRARLWSAISIGSTASLVAVGFTAVYREGFETALFYQSLVSFGSGLGTAILAGAVLAVIALTGVAYIVFKLGRKLPVKTFMNIAVVLVMATSVALIGNAFYTLQAADVITFSRTSGPNLPIFLAEATGIWPTMPSLVAQGVLVSVYTLGALYAFVLRPRLARAPRQRVVNAPA
jgi:high-affinity iron transporter